MERVKQVLQVFNVKVIEGPELLFYFQEGIMCLIEPLNTRITAPNYFLSNLHTGKLFIECSVVFHAYNFEKLGGILLPACSSVQPSFHQSGIIF